ncbi:ATP-binding SpoIIE family protein phosphatase [Microbulbifer yueqingensis]|uniref:ATP-binding SpoIIE family protein phosphatase n=1 Tax=Microbulbifer yueqingensis TaxID=658219 RepID=UPI0015877F50|nr:ATP-binding SpoIIE family protein phosphatase [Microbulbifer yueqingensis]
MIEPDPLEASDLETVLAGCDPVATRAEARDLRVEVRLVDGVPSGLAVFDSFRPHVVIIGPGAGPVAQGIDRLRSRAGLEPVPILGVGDEAAVANTAGPFATCDDLLFKPYNLQLIRMKLVALRRYCSLNRALVTQVSRMRRSQADLLKEQADAREIFRNMGRESCLEETGAIRYHLSPRAVLNGDVLAAAWAPGGKLMLLLGDFTGHGLAAAVGAVPLTSIFYSMVPKGFTLSQIARELNLKLHLVLPSNMFCCAVLLELDACKQHMRILNAGMPAACLSRAGGRLELLESRHLPLGVMRQLTLDNAIEYVPLERGDRLYLWSDGIHEARSTSGEMFGEERLLSLMANSRPADRFEHILSAVNHFSVEQQDDLSLVELCLDEVARDPAAIGEVHRRAAPARSLGDWSFSITLEAEELRDLDPVPLMHRFLSQFPDSGELRDTLSIVLGELCNNAIEHGLLELDSGLKRTESGFAEYYRRLEAGRRNLHRGWVRIELGTSREGERRTLQLLVADSGTGLPRQVEATNAYSGRGLALVQSLCRRLEFSPGVSEVRAVLDWPEEPGRAPSPEANPLPA